MVKEQEEGLSPRDEWNLLGEARAARHDLGVDPLGSRNYAAELAQLKIIPPSRMTPKGRVEYRLKLEASIG